jgi:hypothetical protein
MSIDPNDKEFETNDSLQIAAILLVIIGLFSEFFLSWIEVGFGFWNHLQGLKGHYASSYTWLRFMYRDLGYYDYIRSSMTGQPYKLSKTFWGAQSSKKSKALPSGSV